MFRLEGAKYTRLSFKWTAIRNRGYMMNDEYFGSGKF